MPRSWPFSTTGRQEKRWASIRSQAVNSGVDGVTASGRAAITSATSAPSAAATTSRRDKTPTSAADWSTTGRWRMRQVVMIPAAASTVSPGRIVIGRRVIRTSMAGSNGREVWASMSWY